MTPGGRTKNRDLTPFSLFYRLLLRQDALRAELYQRGEDGRWQHSAFTAPGDVLPLRCLDARVSLAEVYADVPELLG